MWGVLSQRTVLPQQLHALPDALIPRQHMHNRIDLCFLKKIKFKSYDKKTRPCTTTPIKGKKTTHDESEVQAVHSSGNSPCRAVTQALAYELYVRQGTRAECVELTVVGS